jgi:tetratricopeptide (TPR) repeat protein
MKLSIFYMSFLFTVLISFTTGCLAWEPGWKLAKTPAAKGDVQTLLVKAKKLADEADSKEKVQQIIDMYEEAVKIDPVNITSLNELGNYYLLQAYGYKETGEDKKASYLKVLQNTERVMYANPEFKALVDKGEPAWEACRVLKKDEMFAMFNWYLALGNCWTDCYGVLGKMINCQWPGRAKKVLERMTAVDPAWSNGNIYFCWAAFYTISPGMMGGDMKKADDNYKKAITLGPRMSNYYVVRALYFYTKQKDRKAFVEDLNRVIAIDPRKADSVQYPWAIWYQRRAQQLLKDTDTYFK